LKRTARVKSGAAAGGTLNRGHSAGRVFPEKIAFRANIPRALQKSVSAIRGSLINQAEAGFGE
jgi:hypothetical protein